MTAALAQLPASLRASVSQVIEKAGIGSVRFTIWVDDQHQVRKSVLTGEAKTFTEILTTTVTSINQPVSIQLPPPSRTAVLPASDLMLGGV